MIKFAVMPIEDYDNACDRIRNLTGSNDLIKSGGLADKINYTYAVGASLGEGIGFDRGKEAGFEEGKQSVLANLTDVSKEGWSNE